MKLFLFRFCAILVLLHMVTPLAAQSAGSGSTSSTVILFFVAAIILLFVVVNVADNLISVEYAKAGVKSPSSGSFLKKISGAFQKAVPASLKNEHVVRLSKGFDIDLEGAIGNTVIEQLSSTTYAIKPTDFRGIAPIPKLMVNVGDTVAAGDPLFYDKSNPDIYYCAPVSGEVVEINRGAKRSIAEIVILADKTLRYKQFDAPDTTSASRAVLVDFLKSSGAWQLFRQRPYEVVADPNVTPANIFISTFDTAPLAPDNNVIVAGQEAAFHRGLEVLGKLTSGKVHLGLSGNGEVAEAFKSAPAEKHYFMGKHPAGNVGVQMHHIAPVSIENPVWVLGVQDVISLGKLFLEGKLVLDRVYALVGSEFETPKYVRTYAGAKVDDLVKAAGLKNESTRLVSGDPLSGEKIELNGFMGYYDDQLTVIEEGDYYEMFGWLLPQKSRPSISRTFPNFLFSDLKFHADTNKHGEERAFVVTGQYEDVLPMDIYPQHLMKAILANDFERMEGLGLAELVEEDVAICEFVCTSKQPLQQIIRQGLDVMREQG